MRDPRRIKWQLCKQPPSVRALREFNWAGKYAPEVREITASLVLRSQLATLLIAAFVIAKIREECVRPSAFSEELTGPADQTGVSRAYYESYGAEVGVIRGLSVGLFVLLVVLSCKWPWVIKMALPAVLFTDLIYPCGVASAYSEILAFLCTKITVYILLLSFPTWPHLLALVAYPVAAFYVPFLTAQPGTE